MMRHQTAVWKDSTSQGGGGGKEKIWRSEVRSQTGGWTAWGGRCSVGVWTPIARWSEGGRGEGPSIDGRWGEGNASEIDERIYPGSRTRWPVLALS